MVMTCNTCSMPIEGKSITAMGHNYHPDHFICDVCKKPITDKTFHQKNGKPICQTDYELSCPICASCSKPILDKQIIAMGKHFHAAHFCCKMCNAEIVGVEYHEKDGDAVCHNCFMEKLADKCKGCGEPIARSATIALNAKWHPECFKCKKCNGVISSKTFKVDSTGHPVCEGC